MAEEARTEINRILNMHKPESIDEGLAAEIDRIVECSKSVT